MITRLTVAMLVLTLGMVPSLAATIYVQAMAACPCEPTPQGGCGTLSMPYSCIANALDHPTLQVGDTIQVAPGVYAECLRVDKSGVTIRSEVSKGATIARDASHWSCSSQNETILFYGPGGSGSANVVLDGFKITTAAGSSSSVGLYIGDTGPNSSVNDTIKDCEIYGHGFGIWVEWPHPETLDMNLLIEATSVHDNTVTGINLRAPGVQITGGEVSNNGDQGVVLENSGIVVDGVHIHHNTLNGVLSGIGNTIKNSEIDNNGKDFRFSHGLYLKGSGGRVENNRIHHNGSFGIHLWDTPSGYVVERNEVFANGAPWSLPVDKECALDRFVRDYGGGILVGGTEALLQENTVRYNVVHHNLGGGLGYLTGTGGADGNNTFHHNTVYENRGPQVGVTGQVTLKNNIIIGSTLINAGTFYRLLIADDSLAANALDGNLYFHPLGIAEPLFYWNGSPYNFSQYRSQTSQDDHSTWNADVRLVDPDMSPMNEGGRKSNGDYHLRIGSPAIAGVCCVSGGEGILDIDGEQPVACNPDCTSPGNGIGADFYMDTDTDGTADRYDCNPTKKSIKTLCDGDSVSGNLELSGCGNQLGAPYLGSIYPAQGPNQGAPELCDGNDNDCVGGTETDADLDGFSPACGPTPWDDDTDAKIYPGALQFCDGKDNTLLGAETGDVDTDGDGYFDCFTGTPAPNSADCNKTLCCVGPEATEMCGNQRDDNCNELTDESPCEFEPDCQ